MSQLTTVLKRLMLKENLTESELSRRTGIGQPVIHRISSGETDNPKIYTLLPIADYFAITLSELVGDHPLPYAEAPNPAPSKSHVNWSKVPQLAPAQVAHWRELCQPIHPIRTINTSLMLSKEAFAIALEDNSLEPRFPLGTIFIIDPAERPQHEDFCLMLPPKHTTPVMYQIQKTHEGKISYQPLNMHFKQRVDNGGWQNLGVAVQAMIKS